MNTDVKKTPRLEKVFQGDMQRLSRCFNEVSELRTAQDQRINRWLQRIIESTEPTEAQVAVEKVSTASKEAGATKAVAWAMLVGGEVVSTTHIRASAKYMRESNRDAIVRELIFSDSAALSQTEEQAGGAVLAAIRTLGTPAFDGRRHGVIIAFENQVAQHFIADDITGLTVEEAFHEWVSDEEDDYYGPDGLAAGEALTMLRQPTEEMLVAGLNELDPIGKLVNWEDADMDVLHRDELAKAFAAMVAPVLAAHHVPVEPGGIIAALEEILKTGEAPPSDWTMESRAYYWAREARRCRAIARAALNATPASLSEVPNASARD